MEVVNASGQDLYFRIGKARRESSASRTLSAAAVDRLYPLVSAAIRRAERLEEESDRQAPAAHLEVSRLEERITKALPAADPERALARRGAVRAALAARDLDRARTLAERFLAEAPKDVSLQSEIVKLFEQSGLAVELRRARLAQRRRAPVVPSRSPYGMRFPRSGLKAVAEPLLIATLLKARQRVVAGPLLGAATATFWVQGEVLTTKVPPGCDRVELVEANGRFSVIVEAAKREAPRRASA